MDESESVALALCDEARHVAWRAIGEWDLPVIDIEPIKVRENAVFKLHLPDQALAVLRVHRRGYHSNEVLQSEFLWMRALADSGVGVPQVIQSRHERDFEVLDVRSDVRAWQVDVFQWIAGHQLGQVESGIHDEPKAVVDRYRRVGELAALIHRQSASWRLPAEFARPSWDVEGLVGEMPRWGRFWELGALSPRQRIVMSRARDLIGEDLHAFGHGPDRYALVHADLIPDNILSDGERAWIIDFDDCGFGWYLFDLATPLYFLAGTSHFTRARRALIEGYRRVGTLSDETIEHLPLFLAARATTYLGWVHTRADAVGHGARTGFHLGCACALVEEYLAHR